MILADSETTESKKNLIKIILLKTKSLPIDDYEEYFNSLPGSSYDPIFVPVLEHKFNSASLENLKNIILNGFFSQDARENRPLEAYGGLIFTSQRAVQAFCTVIDQIRNETVDINELVPNDVPLYVVGPATARGIKALHLKCPVVGEEAGNGEALASLILSHYGKIPSENDRQRKPTRLLFLVGEKKRDVIPKTLQASVLPEAQRIRVDEITVYETGVMESFPANLAVLTTHHLREMNLQWFVVFSPTGCKAMFETLGMLDEETGRVSMEASPLKRRTFIATIGPTTKEYLMREFGFEPDVCAITPSPGGIGAAIQEFMARHNICPGIAQ